MSEVGASSRPVEAELLYLTRQETTGSESSYASDWPGQSRYRKVKIIDARPIASKLSLDVEGFRLVNAPSAVKNFYDPVEVKNTYYPEVADLIVRITGAVRVVIFAHDTRNRARRGENGVREPVLAVHNDYTPQSGPQMVRESVPSADAKLLLKKRFAEFNAWRPIRGPVQSTPLAVCDARSIRPTDLVPTMLKHEVFMLSYNPDHRWYYFPLMQTDELLILKCFDSNDDGRARYTAHSAFENPDVSSEAPQRESIEVRVLAFFNE